MLPKKSKKRAGQVLNQCRSLSELGDNKEDKQWETVLLKGDLSSLATQALLFLTTCMVEEEVGAAFNRLQLLLSALKR